MKKEVEYIIIELKFYDLSESKVKVTLKEYDGKIDKKDVLFAQASSDLLVLDSIGISACLAVYTYSCMEDFEE